MSELIEYLVARRGAERAAARMAAGISQQFLCKEDRADRFHALIDDESTGAAIAIGETATSDTVRSARTGSPITTFYVRENFTDAAVDEIATPDFGVFD